MSAIGEEVLSRSPEDTEALGRRLAARLAGGGVVWLIGPLGAGKTLLAKSLFGALGADPTRVTSPTFTLINRYSGSDPALALYHVDLYRCEGTADIETLGLEDALGSGGVTVIEWAERLGKGWGEPDIVVRIEDRGGDERALAVSYRPGLTD